MALYKNAGISLPTEQQIQDIADRHKLHISSEEAKDFKDLISGFLSASYFHIDEIADEHLPVKYPRTMGYKPPKEENKFNAWFYKCDIKGAPSGKLAGKKVAIKDNIMVAGIPMINGSQLLSGFVPNEDATVVTRVLDAGGHIIGKANCEDLCFSGSSNTSADGVVFNPIDPTRSAGGSSSGCAVLCQTGEIDMSIGGDQGGSVRIPSSWCGTVAIKPTHGLVPYTGAMPIEPTIDHLGPMTRTVKDCALLLEVIAGYDNGRDNRQPRDLKIPAYSELLNGDIKGMKIGLVKEGFNKCEEDVIKVIRDTTNVFRKLGATVEEISVPEHVEASHLWFPIGFEGAYKTMLEHAGGMLGVKGHQNNALLEHVRNAKIAKSAVMPPTLKLLSIFGAYVTENCGIGYYAKAHSVLPRVTKAFDEVFCKYDVLIMPTLPYKAPKLPTADAGIKELTAHFFGMVSNTGPYDTTGHPAMTINAGSSEGLPIGLQIVGKHWDEATVLRVGYAFEKETGDELDF